MRVKARSNALHNSTYLQLSRTNACPREIAADCEHQLSTSRSISLFVPIAVPVVQRMNELASCRAVSFLRYDWLPVLRAPAPIRANPGTLPSFKEELKVSASGMQKFDANRHTGDFKDW